MNAVAKNKILIWSVVLLMIANVAVLATIWFMHHKNKEQAERGTPAEFLIKQLGLDANQQKQFDSLRKDHQQQSFKIKGDIKDARDNFFKLLQQPDVSDSTKNNASSLVAKNLQALEELTFDHFKKVRAICTPVQQKKFDEIIQEVLRMMGGQQPPPQGVRPPFNGDHPPMGPPPEGNVPPPPQDH